MHLILIFFYTKNLNLYLQLSVFRQHVDKVVFNPSMQIKLRLGMRNVSIVEVRSNWAHFSFPYLNFMSMGLTGQVDPIVTTKYKA